MLANDGSSNLRFRKGAAAEATPLFALASRRENRPLATSQGPSCRPHRSSAGKIPGGEYGRAWQRSGSLLFWALRSARSSVRSPRRPRLPLVVRAQAIACVRRFARRIEPRADSSPSMPIQNRHGLVFSQYRVELPWPGASEVPFSPEGRGLPKRWQDLARRADPASANPGLTWSRRPRIENMRLSGSCRPLYAVFCPVLRPLARFL